jgi:Flp pilus assembly protein CpaB
MRRGRIFFYLAFIMILGLVAVVVIWVRFLQPGALDPGGEVPEPVIETVDVLTVSQRVPRGNIIEASALSSIAIQKEFANQQYFTEPGQVVGRRARVDLEPAMFLTAGLVADSADQLTQTGSDAALTIPGGMVAVSIPIDRLSSVSYAPQRGDHVNIIVSLLFVDLDPEFHTILPNSTAYVLGQIPGSEETQAQLTGSVAGGSPAKGRVEGQPGLDVPMYVIPSERQRPRVVTQTLVQNAVVLHMGEFDNPLKPQTTTTQDQTIAEDTGAAPVQQPVDEKWPPQVITLIVTPQDAVTLNYLMMYDRTGLANARLTLALRSAGDDTLVETQSATLNFLLEQYNIIVPDKLPYGLEAIKPNSVPVEAAP